MCAAINGVILLDKRAGITSNSALQAVKRLFQVKKAGHTGSLDPIATGVLPVCLGKATKFAEFLLSSDKVYRVVAKLGEQTNTGDKEGVVQARADFANISASAWQAAMRECTGTLSQVPPMFSALKHNGVPLYKLARDGVEIERKPRTITVHQFDLIDLEGDLLTCEIRCSKGTYVRTLIEDCAKLVGTVAHVVDLRRTVVFPYQSERLWTYESLEQLKMQQGYFGLLSVILPIISMVSAYPVVRISASSAYYLRMGQAIRMQGLIASASRVRLLSEREEFLGIGTILADGRIQPERLLTDVVA